MVSPLRYLSTTAWRTLAVVALATMGLASLTSATFAQSFGAKPTDRTNVAGDAPPANPLAGDQSQVAARFKRLEGVLLRSAEVEATTNPTRAALLQQAAAMAKQVQLSDAMVRAAKSLEQNQYSQAVKDQQDSLDNLERLLQLLQSENRPERIRNDKEQVRRWIEELDRLQRLQSSLRGRTEGGTQTEKAAADQQKLAEKAAQIAKELGQDTKPAADKKTGDGSDKSSDKSSDEPKADKPSQASDQDSQGKDNKPSDKPESDKPNADKPPGDKPGDDKSGDDKNKSGDPSQSSDEQGKSDKNQSGKDKPGKDDSDKDKSDKDKSDKDKTDKDKTDKDKTDKDGQGKEPSQSGEQPKDKSSDPSQGKPSEQQSPGQQPKPGQQSQPGQQQQQPSDQQQSDDPSESESESAQPQQPQSPTEKAAKGIKQAQKRMQEAQKELEEAKREGAVEKQRQAEQELQAAIEQLEEILRQLREEEIERSLAALEERIRLMLQLQNKVLDETKRLQDIGEGGTDRQVAIRANSLSKEELKILSEGQRALLLLREEGTSAAFPEALTQIISDIQNVAERLSKADVGKLTVSIEQEIVSSLEELVGALAAVQKDQKEKKQKQPNSPGQQQQQSGEQPLVDQLAELRLIKTLQLRINKRTQLLAEVLKDPNDAVGQADADDIQNQLRDLSQRQSSIKQVTRDIVTGKNK